MQTVGQIIRETAPIYHPMRDLPLPIIKKAMVIALDSNHQHCARLHELLEQRKAIDAEITNLTNS